MRNRRGGAVVAAVLLLGLGACAPPAEALDPELDAGRETYGRLCHSCHGASGEGGVGPSLNGVLVTFPDCDTHRDWISLGSERWTSEVGPTYGAAGKPLTGVMPSFEGTLSEEQIQQVAAFERFRYAGATSGDALSSCGL